MFQKGVQNGTPKGGTLWDARLFSVAMLFFNRFWGLPSLLWTIICTQFRGLGIYFLLFSELHVSHMWERVGCMQVFYFQLALQVELVSALI